MPSQSIHPVARTYDAVAAEYGDELDGKPYDLARLDVVVGAAVPGLPVLDVGCGPGEVCRYLRRGGHEVVGIDVSPEMILVAREHDPSIDFYMMDLRAMTFADASFGALVARYSLIHFPRDVMPQLLDELCRVIAPGAPMLVTLYDGEGAVQMPACGTSDGPRLEATLYRRKELEALVAAGADLEHMRVEGRRPYPGEADRFRIFVTAAKKSA